jgi:hypothetical protein
MGAHDGKWFWVALICVPVSNINVLRERDAITPAVQTRVIGMSRYPGREPRGDFGIARVMASSAPDGVLLKWVERAPGRRDRHRDGVAPCGRHIAIQFPKHLVFARAFTDEQEARAWATERHTMPLPRAA